MERREGGGKRAPQSLIMRFTARPKRKHKFQSCLIAICLTPLELKMVIVGDCMRFRSYLPAVLDLLKIVIIHKPVFRFE